MDKKLEKENKQKEKMRKKLLDNEVKELEQML